MKVIYIEIARGHGKKGYLVILICAFARYIYYVYMQVNVWFAFLSYICDRPYFYMKHKLPYEWGQTRLN